MSKRYDKLRLEIAIKAMTSFIDAEYTEKWTYNKIAHDSVNMADSLLHYASVDPDEEEEDPSIYLCALMEIINLDGPGASVTARRMSQIAQNAIIKAKGNPNESLEEPT